MLIRFEMIMVRLLKFSLGALGVLMPVLLLASIHGLDCRAQAYPRSVLVGAFLGVFLIGGYYHLDWFSKGAFAASATIVRIALATSLLLVTIGLAYEAWSNQGCATFLHSAALPGALAYFYVFVAFTALFGDSYLGLFRTVIRMGHKPAKPSF